MDTGLAVDIISNLVIFIVCSWGVFSHKIHDGVLVKCGAILVAIGSFLEAVSMMAASSHVVPSNTVVSIGLALMGLGIFLRVQVYPCMAKKYPIISNWVIPLYKIVGMNRRSTDRQPTNDKCHLHMRSTDLDVKA